MRIRWRTSSVIEKELICLTFVIILSLDPIGVHFEEPDMHEQSLREMITTGSMAEIRAKRILLSMPTRVINSRADIVECIAALTSLFSDEVGRTCPDGRKISSILYTFCAPARLEWLLNYRMARQQIVRQGVEFLGVGTTTNEALHKDHCLWRGISSSRLNFKVCGCTNLTVLLSEDNQFSHVKNIISRIHTRINVVVCHLTGT